MVFLCMALWWQMKDEVECWRLNFTKEWDVEINIQNMLLFKGLMTTTSIEWLFFRIRRHLNTFICWEWGDNRLKIEIKCWVKAHEGASFRKKQHMAQVNRLTFNRKINTQAHIIGKKNKRVQRRKTIGRILGMKDFTQQIPWESESWELGRNFE